MSDESDPACTHTPVLEELIASIRGVVRREDRPAEIAGQVADLLRKPLRDPDLLTPAQRAPDQSAYSQHVLHVEPGGSFSVVALVWLPGQATPVHDHVSWCVPGVHLGREEEVRYRVVEGDEEERWLEEAGRAVNEVGDVCALTPPGDVHRVTNPGPDTAVSIHVYGADIGELGSSIRRTYDLPVRAPVG